MKLLIGVLLLFIGGILLLSDSSKASTFILTKMIGISVVIAGGILAKKGYYL